VVSTQSTTRYESMIFFFFFFFFRNVFLFQLFYFIQNSKKYENENIYISKKNEVN
jgi:hypothetical protein